MCRLDLAELMEITYSLGEDKNSVISGIESQLGHKHSPAVLNIFMAK